MFRLLDLLAPFITNPRIGTAAQCGDGHIMDTFYPKVSIMCPKCDQTPICAQNVLKMWPNWLIMPKKCLNSWLLFGQLQDGAQNMSPWHGSAQNVSIMCPKFGQILDISYTRFNFNFIVQTIEKCPKCVHYVPKLRAHHGHILYKSCLRTSALDCFCGCIRAAHANELEKPYS